MVVAALMAMVCGCEGTATITRSAGVPVGAIVSIAEEQGWTCALDGVAPVTDEMLDAMRQIPGDDRGVDAIEALPDGALLSTTVCGDGDVEALLDIRAPDERVPMDSRMAIAATGGPDGTDEVFMVRASEQSPIRDEIEETGVVVVFWTW